VGALMATERRGYEPAEGACACKMSRLPFIVVAHRTGATEGPVVHNGWPVDEGEHDTW
jgi:hypothetical protein